MGQTTSFDKITSRLLRKIEKDKDSFFKKYNDLFFKRYHDFFESYTTFFKEKSEEFEKYC